MSVIQVTCIRLTSMYLVNLGTLSMDILQCHPMYLVTKHFYFQLFDLAKVATIFAEETHYAANFNGLMGRTS